MDMIRELHREPFDTLFIYRGEVYKLSSKSSEKSDNVYVWGSPIVTTGLQIQITEKEIWEVKWLPEHFSAETLMVMYKLEESINNLYIGR